MPAASLRQNTFDAFLLVKSLVTTMEMLGKVVQATPGERVEGKRIKLNHTTDQLR
jgi:hypothetical protein